MTCVNFTLSKFLFIVQRAFAQFLGVVLLIDIMNDRISLESYVDDLVWNGYCKN